MGIILVMWKALFQPIFGSGWLLSQRQRMNGRLESAARDTNVSHIGDPIHKVAGLSCRLAV